MIVATLLGGSLRGDYDPVRDSISELYEVGAPNAVWLMVLFTVYHASVIPLAAGLSRGLPASRHGNLGPILLGLAGFLGIPLGAYARCDPGCFGATTFRGQLHGILVIATVPLIFAAMLSVWLRLRHRVDWRLYRVYTLTTFIVGVAFGLAMVPFVQGQYAGLLERISVAVILQWYAGSGLMLLLVSRARR